MTFGLVVRHAIWRFGRIYPGLPHRGRIQLDHLVGFSGDIAGVERHIPGMPIHSGDCLVSNV